MPILHTPAQPAALPPMWPLQPGEEPCSAAGAAADLQQLVADTNDDSAAMLAQLGAASDLGDRTRELALLLQEQLAQALHTAAALRAGAG
jgi:hypothetical protein